MSVEPSVVEGAPPLLGDEVVLRLHIEFVDEVGPVGRADDPGRAGPIGTPWRSTVTLTSTTGEPGGGTRRPGWQTARRSLRWDGRGRVDDSLLQVNHDECGLGSKVVSAIVVPSSVGISLIWFRNQGDVGLGRACRVSSRLSGFPGGIAVPTATYRSALLRWEAGPLVGDGGRFRRSAPVPLLSHRLCASRSIKGAAIISCRSSRGETRRECLRQLLGAPVVLVAQHPCAGLGDRKNETPAVARMGMSLDEATCLERPQRRSHRLHADLLALASSVTEVGPLRSNRFRPRPPQPQPAFDPHLSQLSQAQADAHLKSCSNVVNIWILRHIASLTLLDPLSKPRLGIWAA